MTVSARLSLPWAEGEHVFRLAIGQLRELQDKCNAGPAEILGRLSNGTWRVDDIRETIRLGLIGGGATPMDALVLVSRYVEARPLMENVLPAQAILMAAVIGEEAPGKPSPERTKRKATGASFSRKSTGRAPSSA